MTKKVSEVAITELRTGMRVKSLATEVEGVITEIWDKKNDPIDEDNCICFKWDNGNESYGIWHFWCGNVILLDT